MNHQYALGLMLMLFLFSCTQKDTNDQDIELNQLWKLQLGDSVDYAKIDYPDEKWQPVIFDRSIEKQLNAAYDGYVWYRYKVVIPSSIKKNKDIKKLVFNFGKIDDCDRFFLNGHFVGRDNKPGDTSTNNSVSFADVSRIYDLSVDDQRILWDKENTIAIRVLDLGGGGGMQNPPYISASAFNTTQSSKYAFKDNWLFCTGDSTDFSKPGYKDSHWKSILTGQNWESQGYENYDGFAWYRLHTNIPSYLKKDIYKNQNKIQLCLGKVDDNDQVFLNGYLIGENNESVLPPYAAKDDFKNHGTLAGIQRVYDLNFDDKRIYWDKENVIAIRVFDGGGGGGIFETKPYIKTSTTQDDIQMDRSKFYKINDKNVLDTSLVVYNRNKKHAFEGFFSYKSESKMDSKSMGFKRVPIRVKPGDSVVLHVSLPIATDEVLVTLNVDDKDSANLFKDKFILPFVLYNDR